MTAVLESSGLSKRYGKRQALTDCTLTIPAGHVTGLVGPNGAGKTTLLNLAVGLLQPTAGTIKVLGGEPAGSSEQLARVGFVAQDTPTYAGLALPLAIARGPGVRIRDEPIASLDPLARREFLQVLMEATAEQELSVVMSSHLVSDLERACDYMIVLVASRVRRAGEVDHLLATHWQLTGPRCDPAALPDDWEVISASHTDRQSTLLVRTDGPIADPAWAAAHIGLEDLVLAYMSQAAPKSARMTTASMEAQR